MVTSEWYLMGPFRRLPFNIIAPLSFSLGFYCDLSLFQRASRRKGFLTAQKQHVIIYSKFELDGISSVLVL